MKPDLKKIELLKEKIPFLTHEHFKLAPRGTQHTVFISDAYVIRMRHDDSARIARETEILKEIDHALVPKIVWSGTVKGSFVMVENRLSGVTIDTIWKQLSAQDQERITRQITEFLGFLRMQTRTTIYAVATGKQYTHFVDYLKDGIEDKSSKIKRHKQSKEILDAILSTVKNPVHDKLFSRAETTLIHGDLINHNLLTDGKSLSGVLDWEQVLFGDPDYDLCRLFYYHECARAYNEQGNDDFYEAGFMNKLIAQIKKNNLIEDSKSFEQKYQFIRAIFFLNALYWAISSDQPDKNLDELNDLWNKKVGPRA